MNYHNTGNKRYYRKGRRKGLKKEQIIMLSASVFVLTALTMTGVYVNEKNKEDNDEYVVDLSSIEKNIPDKAEKIGEYQSNLQADNDDLDVDPIYQETNSEHVKAELTGRDAVLQIPGVGSVTTDIETTIQRESIQEDPGELVIEEETKEEESSEDVETMGKNVAQSNVSYSFPKTGTLQWPIVGNVLINYSMDKTIYFPTLEQYKYNPAIVIQATKGEPVTAAASGEVVSVFQDAEIGNAVTVDIGDGYEVTYGQLDNIQVGTGENIAEGEMIGYVAEPTKYYVTEGSNVYFKLTKEGEPVNPMGELN